MSTSVSSVSENSFPFVVFKIHDEDYCIASNVVEQMVIQSELNPIPQNPAYMSGIINVRGIIYPIINLRVLFQIEHINEEVQTFQSMKQAHLDWVSALARTVSEKIPFTLAKDSHFCKFGKWYYSYKTTNENLNAILEKIEAPHSKLHEQANIVERCRLDKNDVGANKALEIANDLCHNQIVPLMDQMIDAFITANKGMIILIEHHDSHMGLSVDAVTSIEHFEGCGVDNSSLQFAHNRFIKNVIIAPDDRLFLELDIPALFSLQSEFVLE